MPRGNDAVICREIATGDLEAVARCLARNFRRRGPDFWRRALRKLQGAPPAPGMPRFGHLLEARGEVVGVLLEIGHASGLEGAPEPRCNFSSWCADTEFRGVAVTLPRRALRGTRATFLNLTPAPRTIPIIATLGFRPYARGLFVATPWRQRRTPGARLIEFSAGMGEASALTAWERQMLADHRRWGLDAFVGVSSEGVTPFVLRRRPPWRHWIPAAQLIHSRDIGDVVRFAAFFGRPRLFVNANGPIAGLAGHYVEGRDPHFFRGAAPPGLTDLAYTELALL